jgi:mannose-1-phosphate guanylyltransferase
MFIWSVPSLERAFAAHCPEMHALLDSLTAYAREGKIIEGMEATYPDLKKISVDYALMEKAGNIVMACGTFAWDDVGSWPALESHFPQDEAGNTRIGSVETLDASGNIVLSKDRLTAVIGVKDLVVVQAEGVTLVCPKERAQEIKQMVVALREKGTYDGLL